MYLGIHVKYPLFLTDFNQTWFSRQIFENLQTPNLMKIRPAVAELYHEDRRTDRHKEATSRFSQLYEGVYKIFRQTPDV
jgi:hypothetical protein